MAILGMILLWWLLILNVPQFTYEETESWRATAGPLLCVWESEGWGHKELGECFGHWNLPAFSLQTLET